MSYQERLDAALADLLKRIAAGEEYPDAEWHVVLATGVRTNDLRDAYDAHCCGSHKSREEVTMTAEEFLKDILDDLDKLGIGDDDTDVDGGDAVEYLNALRDDLIRYLKEE